MWVVKLNFGPQATLPRRLVMRTKTSFAPISKNNSVSRKPRRYVKRIKPRPLGRRSITFSFAAKPAFRDDGGLLPL